MCQVLILMLQVHDLVSRLDQFIAKESLITLETLHMRTRVLSTNLNGVFT